MNEMHQKFAKRVRDFIVRHSLDGINLDWPYFSQTMPASSANLSRDHLTLVLQALNENFQNTLAQSSPSSAYLRLQSPIVTLTASKDFYSIVDGYDFHQINKLLDYVHLPAFDFDLNVDQYSIGHPARLHGISDAENLDTLVDLLLSSGLPSEQLVAGIPTHGVQITSRPSSPTGPSTPPAATQQVFIANDQSLDEQLEAAANISIISHSEVCRIRELVRNNCSRSAQESNCWTLSRARDLTAPFAYDSEHWIGFDDETSVKLKAKYVLLRHLAGVALFTANNDDPSGSCGFGSYPLLATVNGVFARAPIIVHPQQQSAGSQQMRSYYTRAPNQILTATSLMSQIFGKKLSSAPNTATTPSTSGDLMSSASDHREAALNHQRSDGSLTSFVDIIEKYGNVNRLDAAAALASAATNPFVGQLDQDQLDRQLPCDRVGYQRYPRDCSRFYRCVQTPPSTPATPSATIASRPAAQDQSSTEGLIATTSTTRLQYECPSGLVFDEQYQICNWPSWSAQCTGSGEVNSITNSKFVCPNYGYFQNQENCEYFYYCSDYSRGQSQAYQFRCPFELGFDEEKLQCNWKWLVKGCNVSSASQENALSSSTSKLAQKYIASLQSGSSTESSPASSARSKREVSSDQKEERVLPGWQSHVTSVLTSVAAFRDQRIKKAVQNPSESGTSLKEKESSTDKLSKYPSFVGAPQTTQKPKASTSSFRMRRRQSALRAPPAGLEASSTGTSPPYGQRPAPPSIFSFLPSSAVYMLVDSLRSVGEALSGEFNRYMRVAGDRVRNVLGVRPPKPTENRREDLDETDLMSDRHKRAKRDTAGPDYAGDLQALESDQVWSGSLPNPRTNQPRYVQAMPYKDPLGRPIGYPLNPLDDRAKAAVLGPEPKMYSQPSHLVSNHMSGISQQEFERIMKSSKDAFELQPKLARSNQKAVYLQHAPEKMFESQSIQNAAVLAAPQSFLVESALPSQPTALDTSRRSTQQADFVSSKHFGMPVLMQRPLIQFQQQVQSQSGSDGSSHKQRRATTMGMRLAHLAMPRFVAYGGLPATKEPISAQASTKSYVSSILPTLSNAVVTPARNFMNKAMDINKVVHDLISTLAPGSSKQPLAASNPTSSNRPEQSMSQFNQPTTPMTPIVPDKLSVHPHHVQYQVNQDHQNHMRPEPVMRPLNANLNHTNLPLLLTEQEARALSAQLDQLSKEQLEVLSNQLFSNPNYKHRSTDQLQAQNSVAAIHQHAPHQPPAIHEPQDYVSKLLKMLSQTSHNPEDVKLLEQLVGQLNNPQPQLQPLIEIGQPDDLALLEALGLVPNKPNIQSNVDQERYTVVEQSGVSHESNSGPSQPGEQIIQSASINQLNMIANHPHHLRQRHPFMQPGAMRPLIQSPQPQAHQPQVVLAHQANMPEHIEVESDYGTTTKFVPVRLEFIDEPTTPATREPTSGYNSYEPSTSVYSPEPAPSKPYHEPSPVYYYTTSTTTTTTTTTTTPRPVQVVTQVFEEQIVERPVPPVKQTFSELIESNVTTPDGVETSVETRTKSAISSGAGFSIASQLGLGMVPRPFAGSAPVDSDQFQSELAKTPPSESGTTTSSKNDSSAVNFATSTPSSTTTLGSESIPNQASISQSSQPFTGRPINNRMFNQQFPGGQFVSSSFTSSRDALPSGPTVGGATLGSYNFASQPVDQFEEVVIKKKFKPFPKVVPQTSRYSLEEVRSEITPAPQTFQQTSFIDDSQQQQQQQLDSSGQISQQQIQLSDLNTGLTGGLVSQVSADTSGSISSAFNNNEEQIKEEDFTTVASTFGEMSTNQGSLTKQELEQQQRFEDLQRIVNRQFDSMNQPNVDTSGGSALNQGRFKLDEPASGGIKSLGEKRRKPKKAKSKPTGESISTTAKPETTKPTRSVSPEEDVTEPSTTTTRSTTTSTTVAPQVARRRADRVEAAFSNFMVELKRSRKQSNSSEISTDATSTTVTPRLSVSSNPLSSDRKKRKSRSKQEKGKNGKKKSTTVGSSAENLIAAGSEHHRSRSAKSRTTSNSKKAANKNIKGAKHSPQRSLQTNKKGQQPIKVIGDHEGLSSTQRGPETMAASASYILPRQPLVYEHKITVSPNRPAALLIPAQRYQDTPITIYGTKSGFMPMIGPDNPNYSSTAGRETEEDLSAKSSLDPLNFAASIRTASKDQAPESELSYLTFADSYKKKPTNLDNSEQSWSVFVRKLRDQISVVNLGNYSDYKRINNQVRLIILPASPNNQLLNANNWQHLAAYYPQLFPQNLAALDIGPLDLGPTSISLQTGLIDERLESMRTDEFRRKLEPVSRLIETATFKALDEIVQRSSGQMFHMHRKDEPSQTLIAVIPDRPLIKQQVRSSTLKSLYQRQVATPAKPTVASSPAISPEISTTQYPQTSTSTTTVTPVETNSPEAPKRAAAFSRAIQESIQEAIRQHYSSMKNKIKQSLETTTMAAWSTPSADSLASLESAVNNQQVDPMDMSSSSTEFSVIRVPAPVEMTTQASTTSTTTTTTTTTTTQSPSVTKEAPYSTHPVYEVEGGEPKALYGIDVNSRITEQSVYFDSSTKFDSRPDIADEYFGRKNSDTSSENQQAVTKSTESSNASKTPATTTTTATFSTTTSTTTSPLPKSRFISIGSHLINSPLKLPKVVDQAYVNHFYDHISDHKLAKASGFNELANGSDENRKSAENDEREQQQHGDQTVTVSFGEDSLVPESACTRAGLFQHPFACNKFYECFWDKQLSKYTLHMFECPIKLAFDDRIVGCAMPIESSLCVNY